MFTFDSSLIAAMRTYKLFDVLMSCRPTSGQKDVSCHMQLRNAHSMTLHLYACPCKHLTKACNTKLKPRAGSKNWCSFFGPDSSITLKRGPLSVTRNWNQVVAHCFRLAMEKSSSIFAFSSSEVHTVSLRCIEAAMRSSHQ